MSTAPQDFNDQINEGFVTAHLAATFAGLPVYVHAIQHADGVVLVDTGMIDSTPELDEEGARCRYRRTSPETSCVSSTPTFTLTTAAATACFAVCRSTSRGSNCKGLMTRRSGSTSRVRPV